MLIKHSLHQMRIESVRKEKELKAESMVRTQFKMESLVYTQDTRYTKKLGKRKREDLDVNLALSGSSAVDSKGTLREMVKHLKSYYKVSLSSRVCGFLNTSRLQKHYFRSN